jgi:hypothetical protein
MRLEGIRVRKAAVWRRKMKMERRNQKAEAGARASLSWADNELED